MRTYGGRGAPDADRVAEGDALSDLVPALDADSADDRVRVEVRVPVADRVQVVVMEPVTLAVATGENVRVP